MTSFLKVCRKTQNHFTIYNLLLTTESKTVISSAIISSYRPQKIENSWQIQITWD